MDHTTYFLGLVLIVSIFGLFAILIAISNKYKDPFCDCLHPRITKAESNISKLKTRVSKLEHIDTLA